MRFLTASLLLLLLVPSSGVAAKSTVGDELLGEELVGRWAHYDVVA